MSFWGSLRNFSGLCSLIPLLFVLPLPLLFYSFSLNMPLFLEFLVEQCIGRLEILHLSLFKPLLFLIGHPFIFSLKSFTELP
jgi:hypothetical protein